MTERKQRDIVKDLIDELKPLLSQAKEAVSKDDITEAMASILKIKNQLECKTSIKHIPKDYSGTHFGPGGLTNRETVVSVCYVKEIDEFFHIPPDNYVVADGLIATFVNRQVGKHAEIELLEWLEWLSENQCHQASEIRIVISRAPCKNCLKMITEFLQERRRTTPHLNKCRIGFYHWYIRSSLGQMSNAIKTLKRVGIELEFSVLTLETMGSGGIFRFLFLPRHRELLAVKQIEYLETDKRRQKDVYNQAWESAKKDSTIPTPLLGIEDMFKFTVPFEHKLEELLCAELNREHRMKQRAQEMMVAVFGSSVVLSEEETESSTLKCRTVVANGSGPDELKSIWHPIG